MRQIACPVCHGSGCTSELTYVSTDMAWPMNELCIQKPCQSCHGSGITWDPYDDSGPGWPIEKYDEPFVVIIDATER